MSWLLFVALNFILPGLIFFCLRGRIKKIVKFFQRIKNKPQALNVLEILHRENDEFKNIPESKQELPKDLLSPQGSDSHLIYGLDHNGNCLIIKIVLKNTLHAEVMIEFRLNNGKVYKLPDENGVRISSIQTRQWKAQGLYIQTLEPYRRLRITFNGIMRENNKNEFEHVQFNFIWNAGSSPFHYPKNIHKDVLIETISECLGENNWLSEGGYEQFGCLTGLIKGSKFEEELKFRLPSYRRRSWGCDSLSIKKEISTFVISKNGTLFHTGIKFINGVKTLIRHGLIHLSNGETHLIRKLSTELEEIDKENIPTYANIHITVGKNKYSGIFPLKKEFSTWSIFENDRRWEMGSFLSKVYFDHEEGDGVTVILQQFPGNKQELPKALLLPKTIKNPENILLCRLNKEECLDLSLTGGKGNSLGLLSNITSNLFTVPPGFVVTVSAYNRQVETNTILKEAIKHLENVCYGKIEGNLEETCKVTSEKFTKEAIYEDLAQKIMNEINNLNAELDEEVKQLTWAVRSSGIGEDSDDLSAAGQNSTFLGCRNEDVLKAIAACWGSLYTFQSVEYRRQHGIPVNCAMAVVVQKTIPADSAGVLFTCHPATGNPEQMIITSNYGLGESVVSASADPDTITLSRKFNGDINVAEYNIGKKNIQITLEGDAGGTKEKEIEKDLAEKLSITEQQAVELGKMGILLEREFGNPRDIEWSFYKNKLYLLQSRPVTTLNTWTDFELLHEFDTPVFSEKEVFTRVNIGEVMKGAITPLTYSATLIRMEKLIQREMQGSVNPYVSLACQTVLHYGFLNVMNMLYKDVPREINVEIRIAELAMLGHPFMDEKIHKEAVRRHGVSEGFKKLWSRSKLINKAFFKKDRLETAIEINKNFDILINDNDSVEEINEKIINSFYVFERVLGCYTNVNFTNTLYNMLCVSILTGGKSDFTPDHYHDIALVLKTKGGVETVELPIILEEIADCIRKSGKKNEFLEKKPEECKEWMEKNSPEAARIFQKFLEVHGHRLFSEYEFASKPWIEDPTPIIEMIQANSRVEAATKMTQGLDVEETVSKLLTPQSSIKRKILKFLIRKLRESLLVKEETKSQMIRCIGKFRSAYKKLSEKLVSEGFIPRKDLMYHLTETELRQIITMRDPVIISKAIRRQRLFQQWNKMQFSDLYVGFPKPDRDGTESFVVERKSGDSVSLKGTPVCTGTIIGRACVIFDLKECVQIQSGDILVTYSTDVGWTPYFPMLSGVVTEIGGLLSHGAVVAREYGLPCIVGVQGATKAFKTGDKILLNGKTGELKLVAEN